MSSVSYSDFAKFYHQLSEKFEKNELTDVDKKKLNDKITKNFIEIIKLDKELFQPSIINFTKDGTIEIKKESYGTTLKSAARGVRTTFRKDTGEYDLSNLNVFVSFVKNYFSKVVIDKNEAVIMESMALKAVEALDSLKLQYETGKALNREKVTALISQVSIALTRAVTELFLNTQQLSKNIPVNRLSTFAEILPLLGLNDLERIQKLEAKFTPEIKKILGRELEIPEYSDFLRVIDALGSYPANFPSREDKFDLLCNLILKKPSKQECDDLIRKLKEIEEKNILDSEKMEAEQGILRQSRFCQTAMVSIDKRALQERERMSEAIPQDARTILAAKVGTSFLLATGVAVLVVLFPKLLIATPFGASFAKEGVQNAISLWTKQSPETQGKIRNDIETLLMLAKTKPKELLEKINSMYKENRAEGEKLLTIVNDIVKFEKEIEAKL